MEVVFPDSQELVPLKKGLIATSKPVFTQNNVFD